jgi:hypothetical protein
MKNSGSAKTVVIVAAAILIIVGLIVGLIIATEGWYLEMESRFESGLIASKFFKDVIGEESRERAITLLAEIRLKIHESRSYLQHMDRYHKAEILRYYEGIEIPIPPEDNEEAVKCHTEAVKRHEKDLELVPKLLDAITNYRYSEEWNDGSA